MKSQLFIPEKIHVGFNKRSDTYTDLLGFVTYYDLHGKLRKEKSLNGWRSPNIQPKDFLNEPTEGFVINKNVGGVKGSWSSRNVRKEYARVYDPRGFEIEITIPNLIFILEEASSIKGKGLEGEFVYAWDGQDLVLLPVDCEDYRSSLKITEKQKCKSIGIKDLVVGYTYLLKKNYSSEKFGKFLYLGKYATLGNFTCLPVRNYNVNKESKIQQESHVFYDEENYDIVLETSGKNIVECVSETFSSNFADLRAKIESLPFINSVLEYHFSPVSNEEADRIFKEGIKEEQGRYGVLYSSRHTVFYVDKEKKDRCYTHRRSLEQCHALKVDNKYYIGFLCAPWDDRHCNLLQANKFPKFYAKAEITWNASKGMIETNLVNKVIDIENLENAKIGTLWFRLKERTEKLLQKKNTSGQSYQKTSYKTVDGKLWFGIGWVGHYFLHPSSFMDELKKFTIAV